MPSPLPTLDVTTQEIVQQFLISRERDFSC